MAIFLSPLTALFLKIQRFDVGHLKESCFKEGVRAVAVLVFRDDHFLSLNHVVDALPAVPVGMLRVAVLDSEERVFLDILSTIFLFAEGIVDLPLFGKR